MARAALVMLNFDLGHEEDIIIMYDGLARVFVCHSVDSSTAKSF